MAKARRRKPSKKRSMIGKCITVTIPEGRGVSHGKKVKGGGKRKGGSFKRKICFGRQGIKSNSDVKGEKYYTKSKPTSRRQSGGANAGRRVRVRTIRQSNYNERKWTAHRNRRNAYMKKYRKRVGSTPSTQTSTGRKLKAYLVVPKSFAFVKGKGGRPKLRAGCRKKSGTNRYECKRSVAQRLKR